MPRRRQSLLAAGRSFRFIAAATKLDERGGAQSNDRDLGQEAECPPASRRSAGSMRSCQPKTMTTVYTANQAVTARLSIREQSVAERCVGVEYSLRSESANEGKIIEHHTRERKTRLLIPTGPATALGPPRGLAGP